MKRYYRFVRGLAPVGALVLRFYRSGGEVKGFLREIGAEEKDDSIFPSEELSPDVAFRLADNKRVSLHQPVYVELAEDIDWNPDWGELC